jgi:hypothetical protein
MPPEGEGGPSEEEILPTGEQETPGPALEGAEISIADQGENLVSEPPETSSRDQGDKKPGLFGRFMRGSKKAAEGAKKIAAAASEAAELNRGVEEVTDGRVSLYGPIVVNRGETHSEQETSGQSETTSPPDTPYTPFPPQDEEPTPPEPPSWMKSQEGGTPQNTTSAALVESEIDSRESFSDIKPDPTPSMELDPDSVTQATDEDFPRPLRDPSIEESKSSDLDSRISADETDITPDITPSMQLDPSQVRQATDDDFPRVTPEEVPADGTGKSGEIGRIDPVFPPSTEIDPDSVTQATDADFTRYPVAGGEEQEAPAEGGTPQASSEDNGSPEEVPVMPMPSQTGGVEPDSGPAREGTQTGSTTEKGEEEGAQAAATTAEEPQSAEEFEPEPVPIIATREKIKTEIQTIEADLEAKQAEIDALDEQIAERRRVLAEQAASKEQPAPAETTATTKLPEQASALHAGESPTEGAERLSRAVEYNREQYEKIAIQMSSLEELRDAVSYLSLRKSIEDFRRKVEAGQEIQPEVAPSWAEWDRFIELEGKILREYAAQQKLSEEQLRDYISMRQMEQQALAGTREDGTRRSNDEISDPADMNGYTQRKSSIEDLYQTRGITMPSQVSELVSETAKQQVPLLIKTYSQTLGGMQYEHYLSRNIENVTSDDVSMLEMPLADFKRVVFEPARERYEKAEEEFQSVTTPSHVEEPAQPAEDTDVIEIDTDSDPEMQELLARRERLTEEREKLQRELETSREILGNLEPQAGTEEEPESGGSGIPEEPEIIPIVAGGRTPKEPVEETPPPLEEPDIEPALSPEMEALRQQLSELQDSASKMQDSVSEVQDRVSKMQESMQETIDALKTRITEVEDSVSQLAEASPVVEPPEPAEPENDDEESTPWWKRDRAKKIYAIAAGVAIGAAVVAGTSVNPLAAVMVAKGAKFATKIGANLLERRAARLTDKGEDVKAARNLLWAKRLRNYAGGFFGGAAWGAGLMGLAETFIFKQDIAFLEKAADSGYKTVTGQDLGRDMPRQTPGDTITGPGGGGGYDQFLQSDHYQLPDNWRFLENARGWHGTNLSLSGTEEGEAFRAMINYLKSKNVPPEMIEKILAQGKDLPLGFHDAVSKIMGGMNPEAAIKAADVIIGGNEKMSFLDAVNKAIQAIPSAATP